MGKLYSLDKFRKDKKKECLRVLQAGCFFLEPNSNNCLHMFFSGVEGERQCTLENCPRNKPQGGKKWP